MFFKEKRRLAAEERAKREAAQSAVITANEAELAKIKAIPDPTDRFLVLRDFHVSGGGEENIVHEVYCTRKKRRDEVNDRWLFTGIGALFGGAALLPIEPITALSFMASGVGGMGTSLVRVCNGGVAYDRTFLDKLDNLKFERDNMMGVAVAQCDVAKLMIKVPDQIDGIFAGWPDLQRKFNKAALQKELAQLSALKPKPVIAGTIDKYAKLGDRRK